jgi:hypothetical protein
VGEGGIKVEVAVCEGGGEVAVAVGESVVGVAVIVAEVGRDVAEAEAESGVSGFSGADTCDWQEDMKRKRNPISMGEESRQLEIFVIMYFSS